MIAIETVLQRLNQATRGDREIDYMIAMIMGWKRVENAAGPEKRTLWLIPSGKEEAKVPTYTSNLHDAYALARTVAPGLAAGCAWEPNKGSARIGDEPYVEAATPILALCAASIGYKRKSYG